MVEKHKVHAEDNNQKISINPIWLVVAGIILLILVNLVGKYNPISESKVTPTVTINILPAEGLNTDQANYVKLAVADLADKLKIKPEDIKVVNVRVKQWNDSSLGCPQKGMLYIQSITPGYIIGLSASGKTYIYNGGLNRVVSC